MAMKKFRNMKVYEQSGYQYKSTPAIMLKGQWLREAGFDCGTSITVTCEEGRLVIVPREEDGIMERGGGFLYGDHPGSVPDFHRLFFCDPRHWWSGLWSQVSAFFTDTWNAILQNPIVQLVVTTITSLWENAKNTLQGIWSGICQIASGAFELLKNVILAPVLLLIDLVTGNFSQLASDAANIWDNIKNAASQIWSGIRQVVTSAASGLKQGVETVLSALSQFASQICRR